MNTIASPLAQLEAAAGAGKLSAAAAANIRTWLVQPYLRDYAPQVAEHLAAEKWAELEEAFWTTVPFGTGGRRGRMYPIGCNAINDRTIGETAQGLADYVKEQAAAGERVRRGACGAVPAGCRCCAVAYDTRHRSRQFAELCSEIMAAAGFTVYFLDGYRSTPELSFAVRHKGCDCGVMITASHNPPSDNAVKVYGPSGGQYVPPHDAASIHRMEQVTFVRRTPFAEARAAGKVVYCQEEVDAAFIKAVLAQSLPGPRELKILYSPLHGVGASAVYPVLREAGFREVEIFGPHAAPDGDFPNVPKHVANPENPAVFDTMIDRARESGAELILATDPDCDRLGCAERRRLDRGAPWATLTGNQLGSLLTDFLLSARQAAGTLTPEHYIVKTLVTTELMRRIADRYGVADGRQPARGVQVDRGRDRRPRAGAVRLRRGGVVWVPGRQSRPRQGRRGGLAADGRVGRPAEVGRQDALPAARRIVPRTRLFHRGADQRADAGREGDGGDAGVDGPAPRRPARLPGRAQGGAGPRLSQRPAERTVSRNRRLRWACEPLRPQGDMVILDLEAAGNYLAVRPSGTEPKVKIYLFAYDPPAGTAAKPWSAAELEPRPPRRNASGRSAAIFARFRGRETVACKAATSGRGVPGRATARNDGLPKPLPRRGPVPLRH